MPDVGVAQDGIGEATVTVLCHLSAGRYIYLCAMERGSATTLRWGAAHASPSISAARSPQRASIEAGGSACLPRRSIVETQHDARLWGHLI